MTPDIIGPCINFPPSPSAFSSTPGPPSIHPAFTPGNNHSFQIFSPSLFTSSCASCSPLRPIALPCLCWRERDILLASMRKEETGRGSEQCQQIREVQKPQQEACQSTSIMRASETQGKNMRSANCAGMSSLLARSSQRASDKSTAIYFALFRDYTICQVNTALYYIEHVSKSKLHSWNI